MAGVTDRPFRQLCKNLGVGSAVSEMISSNPNLRDTRKSQLRSNHQGETGLRWVQIVGADASMLADAARYNVKMGAEIIDINMGCPAKKVNRKLAGSALMADESLVADICNSVVKAVDVPVTLKIRTGIDDSSKNAPKIAQIAEESGIALLTVHGRTKQAKFSGDAEYETIRKISSLINIPLIANGDIDSPEKAKWLLETMDVDGLMIGRAAQGNPWIFQQIKHYLQTGKILQQPSSSEVIKTMVWHISQLHEFYGSIQGVRVARKHVAWYLKSFDRSFVRGFNKIVTPNEQLIAIKSCFKNTKLSTVC